MHRDFADFFTVIFLQPYIYNITPTNQRPDLQNIIRQSYDNPSYDRLTMDVSFTKHLTKNARIFLSMIHLQNHKIVGDSVRILAYDIPKRNLSTF